jgi:tellurite resistance protein TerC
MEDEVTMDLLGSGTPLMWGGFLAFVLSMLAIDLGVFHRKSHAITFREAAGWSVVWVALALAFGGLVYLVFGPVSAMEYLTGYVVEKSLAVDNIFVFVAVFSAFAVPAVYQHRVLFWGVLGALLMRAAFIFAGAALLEHFHWTMYLFGGFLLLTGVKMLMQKEEASEVTHNPLYRLIRRWVPSTDGYRGGRFFVVEQGRRLATPLFFVLVLIEIVDLVFATDSIPAIFAITTEPFIVVTSNVFAILGLRSLYFALAGMMDKFAYLKISLAFVLIIVGIKMLAHNWLKQVLGENFNLYMLSVVLAILGAGVVASLVRNSRESRDAQVP